jgi:hypothetical protein
MGREISLTRQLLECHTTAQSRTMFEDVFGVAPEHWSVADDLDTQSLYSVLSVVNKAFTIEENLAYIIFARFLSIFPGTFNDFTDIVFCEMHPSQSLFGQGSLIALLATMTHGSSGEICERVAIFLRNCIDEQGVIEVPSLFFVVVKMSQFLREYSLSGRTPLMENSHLVIQEILKCTSPQEVKRIFRAYAIVFISGRFDQNEKNAGPPVIIVEFIRRCFYSSDISKSLRNGVESALTEIFHEYILIIGNSLNKSQSDQIDKFKRLFASIHQLSNAKATAMLISRCAIAANLKVKIRQEAIDYLLELMLRLQTTLALNDTIEESKLTKKVRHSVERNISENNITAGKEEERLANMNAYKTIAILAFDAAMLDPSETIRISAMKGLSRAFMHSQFHQARQFHPELMIEFLKVCALKCNDVSDRVRRIAIASLTDIGAVSVVKTLGVEESMASLRRIYLVNVETVTLSLTAYLMDTLTKSYIRYRLQTSLVHL